MLVWTVASSARTSNGRPHPPPIQPRFYFGNEFSEFRSVFADYPHKVVYANPGTHLKPVGEYMDGNFYLAEGVCQVTVHHDSGANRLIGFWGADSIYPIIASDQHFNLERTIAQCAITETRAWKFSFETTRRIMKEHPEVSYAMIDHYGRYTNALKFLATAQTYESLRTRICNAFYIRDIYGSVGPAMTQSELASIIGARRESVVKVLAQLKSDGIVESDGRKIWVTDREALERECSALLK